DYEENGVEKVELLTAPWAAPGTLVTLEGNENAVEKPAKIDIDRFCKIDYRIVEKHATAAGKNLVAAGKCIETVKTVNGEIS
ncbi:MAG: phenylalanine--tRNA ligase subunit beta, partial [Spirochaetia bacterium]|nr:phenylalanine--tRNA ligase subunit beta [Spirochaetia bacterium]